MFLNLMRVHLKGREFDERYLKGVVDHSICFFNEIFLLNVILKNKNKRDLRYPVNSYSVNNNNNKKFTFL